MSSLPADPEYVPSGFMHPDKRRVGGLGRAEERHAAKSAQMIGRVFVERAQHAKDLAESISAVRAAKPSNSRSRRAAPKSRVKSNGRETFVGPTEARLAKGDVVTVGGVYRSAPPIESLRKDFDSDPKTALAMYSAAQKLQRHFEGHVNGSRAVDSIDIEAALSPNGRSDLEGEEGWVHHYTCFREACRVMGNFPDRPNHGCARIVVAVVCYEKSLREAAKMCVVAQREERMQTIALDRLRSGLLTLAFHWKFL